MDSCVIYARFSSYGQDEQVSKLRFVSARNLPRTRVLRLSIFIPTRQGREQTTLVLLFSE